MPESSKPFWGKHIQPAPSAHLQCSKSCQNWTTNIAKNNPLMEPSIPTVHTIDGQRETFVRVKKNDLMLQTRKWLHGGTVVPQM
mmetsp:Transcript_129766/g.224307  ORF Transcript_129766/g.224307 Transcript_129766/m.224307 type:complete len:84 (+) Transcript_129766:739-990(+)